MPATLKSRIERLEAEQGLQDAVHVHLKDYCLQIFDSNERYYEPSVTGLTFHKSNDFVRLMIGPYGSGKSTACCAEIIIRSIHMPPCKDGIRKSRWAVIRNTYGDLESTSLKTWLDWFSELGKVKVVKKQPLVVYHSFNDGNGLIELEVMLLALDRPDQIRKLKSLELTGVYLNEMSEIPQAAFTHFKGRVHRFPSEKDCENEYWSGIIADTNPPEVDHWVYKLFEIEKPERHHIFHQPPALIKQKESYEVNLEADNVKHLAVRGNGQYYRDMIVGQTEEFIKVYGMGQYGTVVSGKFVYTNYNDDLHSSPLVDLEVEEPLALFFDYGTVSPACLLVQYIDGQLRCIKEFVCEYMTVKELYTSAIHPFLAKHCQGMMLDIAQGDPADTYDGRQQLDECGLEVEPAKTNHVEPRIRSVRDFLNGLIEGQPKLVVSRDGCPKLRQGFLGKYNYRRLRVIGEEKYQDVPNKTHPYSDIHDCLQYAAMYYGDFDFVEEEELIWPSDLLTGEEKGKSTVGGY